MMESKKYIHYGCDSFDRNLFQPIVNRERFVKPHGGLWASPVDSEWGWKDWCTSESFHTDRLSESFTFTLSENAKVIHIRSVSDLTELPNQKPSPWFPGVCDWKCIDFEKLLADGVDAVELHLSEEDRTNCGFMDGLYWELYGWDCDSILILNPDVVEV